MYILIDTHIPTQIYMVNSHTQAYTYTQYIYYHTCTLTHKSTYTYRDMDTQTHRYTHTVKHALLNICTDTLKPISNWVPSFVI